MTKKEVKRTNMVSEMAGGGQKCAFIAFLTGQRLAEVEGWARWGTNSGAAGGTPSEGRKKGYRAVNRALEKWWCVQGLARGTRRACPRVVGPDHPAASGAVDFRPQ